MQCERREERGGEKMDGWRSDQRQRTLTSSCSSSFSLSFQLNKKQLRFLSFRSDDASALKEAAVFFLSSNLTFTDIKSLTTVRTQVIFQDDIVDSN